MRDMIKGNIIKCMIALVFPWVTLQYCTIKQKPTSDAVAIVNNDIISRKYLDMSILMAKRRMKDMGQEMKKSELEELEKTLLDRLIGEQLIYQEAARRNITVNEVKVDKNLERAWMGYSGKEEFDELMHGIGLSDKDVRTRIRQEAILQKFIDEVITPGITVTDDDVNNFYEENKDHIKIPKQLKARQIVLMVNKNAEKKLRDQAFEKIKMIQEKIKNGADFAELAKEYSEGPAGLRGGDMGTFGPGDLVKPLEDAAYSLKPGEVSDVVETRFGLHLMKLEGEIPESYVPIENVRSKLESHLNQKKIENDLNEYIEKLKKTAKIETFL